MKVGLTRGATHFSTPDSYILCNVSSLSYFPLCSSTQSGRLSVDVDESVKVVGFIHEELRQIFSLMFPLFILSPLFCCAEMNERLGSGRDE